MKKFVGILLVLVLLLSSIPAFAATQTTVSGGFSKPSISVQQGKKKQLTGSLKAKNGKITRVTINVSYYYNDRFMSKDLGSGKSSVDLDDYNVFTVDTTQEPFNVPGDYELKMYVATSDGQSFQVDTMTVTVTEAPKAAAVTVSGGFAKSSISVEQGKKKQLTGSLSAKNGKITRITINVSYYYNDRFMSKDLGSGKSSVDLDDYSVFTVDTTQEPFNVPGDYELKMYVAASDGQSFQVDTMTVTVTEPAKASAVTVSGGFAKSSISVEQGKKKQLTGSLSAKNGKITRVTVNVTGFYNDRFLSKDLGSGKSSVDLDDYSVFTVDTTQEPFNAPGTYELKMYAAASDGQSFQVDTMTVTVTEPAKPDAVTVDGGFAKPSIKVDLGKTKQLTGSLSAKNGKIVRVTINVTGFYNDRFLSEAFSSGKKSVDISNYDVFTINTKKEPFNAPGTYELKMYVGTDDGSSFQLDTMTVIIEDPNGSSTSHSDPVISDTSPDHYNPPAPVRTPVSVSGRFGESSVTLFIGEKQKLQGEISSQNGTISKVTIEITGNGRTSKKTASYNSSDVDLSRKFEIDTDDSPFNKPGEYTLTLNVELSDKTTHTLGTMYVTIKEKKTSTESSSDSSSGYNNNIPASDTRANQQTKEPSDQPAQKQPVKMSVNIPDTSINVTLGDISKIGGYIKSENGNIAEVRLSVNGMVFAKKIINAKSVMFSDDDFIIKTDSAPFNAAGSYTVDIMACAEDSSDFETLKSVTITVEEKKSSGNTNNNNTNQSSEKYNYSQEVQRIKTLAKSTYSSIYTAHGGGFKGYCGTFVGKQANQLGFIYKNCKGEIFSGQPDGRDWVNYSRSASNDWKESTKGLGNNCVITNTVDNKQYTQRIYLEKDAKIQTNGRTCCLYDLLHDNGYQNVYNIIISYSQKTVNTALEGHVRYIYAILRDPSTNSWMVYFMDNMTCKGVSEGNMVVTDLEDFIVLSEKYYYINGIIHFELK